MRTSPTSTACFEDDCYDEQLCAACDEVGQLHTEIARLTKELDAALLNLLERSATASQLCGERDEALAVLREIQDRWLGRYCPMCDRVRCSPACRLNAATGGTP